MVNLIITLQVMLFAGLPNADHPQGGHATTPKTLAVDTSYLIPLGGVQQYLEIRGASPQLPVLLYLHGGPGMPATPLLRYHQARLSDSFIVASWDQRGCGRSALADPNPGNMTLERHVQDAHELTDHLKRHFGKERIFLVGHSWGSVLGVELAQRYPEDYLAYLGIGQVVSIPRGDDLARKELVRRALTRDDTATVQAVEAIAFSPEDGYGEGLPGFLAHRRLLWMNGMMDHDPSAMMEAIGAAEGYPNDIEEWSAAASYAQGALFDDLMAVDFTRRTQFRIPVFFFVGRHDFNTPGRLVREYMEAVEAPEKSITWFEEAGHDPPWEMPEAFRARLLEAYEKAVAGI
jgi:pimeloyl-ACP methyl ester carboxylesterase